jgi:hypothetical protein
MPNTSNGAASLPLSLVHVSGRRVSWSSDPTWYPRGKARGPEYSSARRAGKAGQSRERADRVIVRLLTSGAVRGVLVTGEGARVAWATRTESGLYRTAWGTIDEKIGWWPTNEPKGPEYERARDLGLAGVVYGLEPLREVLAGGIVPERDWRGEIARAQARKPAAPSLEDLARRDLTVAMRRAG